MRSQFKGIFQTSLKVCLLGYVIIHPHHLLPSDAYARGKAETIEIYMPTDEKRHEEFKHTAVHRIIIEGGPYESVSPQLQKYHNDEIINIGDTNGNTPLHYVVWHKGHTALAQLLLLYGANINCRNNDGLTPVFLAIINKDCEMFEVLSMHCPDITFLSEHNLTYLHFAIAHNAPREIKISLLKNPKLNIGQINTYGHDALSFARLILPNEPGEARDEAESFIKDIENEVWDRRAPIRDAWMFAVARCAMRQDLINTTTEKPLTRRRHDSPTE